MPKRKRTDRPKAPAEGERAAIGGYFPQYRVSAFLILHALQEQTLERIRLADPKAGRVDDFQLERAGQLDAYQIKWSMHRGKFSLSDLLATHENSPALIKQLSDGWTLLRSTVTKRVIVHLIANDLPSDTDLRWTPKTGPGNKVHFLGVKFSRGLDDSQA